MGFKEFTGELDSPVRVRPFTGELDPDPASRPLPEGVEPSEVGGGRSGGLGGMSIAQGRSISRSRGGLASEARPYVAQGLEQAPAPSAPSAIATELGSLRDTFFSGVDSARAGLKTLNLGAQANLLQQTQAKLSALESSGQSTTPEAEGLRKTLTHYSNRMPVMAADTAEAQADARRGAAMVEKPEVRAVMEAKSFGEAWEAFKKAPYEVISGITAQSLPSMLPALVVGALTGPAAGAAMMGLSSGATEAGGSLAEYAQEQGVDVANPQALQAFFSDKQKLAEAMAYAGKRAGIIGTLDAVSGGVAGKTIAPAMKSAIGRQAVNLPAQMGVQAGLGAGGEALGQIATKGHIDQPGQVLAEGVGEWAGAPLDVAAFGRQARAAAKQGEQIRPAEIRKATESRFDDYVAEHGMPPKLVAAIKEAAADKPLDKLPEFYKQATRVLAQDGLFTGAVDDAALARLDHPILESKVDPEVALSRIERQGRQDQNMLRFGGRQEASPVDAAAHEAAASPTNDLADPTPAQAEAGNYKMGHATISGMGISFENPAGSVRRGVDKDGAPWETQMRAHYGYFKGTTAPDGDKLDVFVRPGTAEDYSGPVFVVDQIDPNTGEFDEAKVMLGYDSEQQAEAAYRENYAIDWQGFGAITRLPMPAFKAWAASNETRSPLGNINAANPARNGGQSIADAGRGDRGQQLREQRSTDMAVDAAQPDAASVGGMEPVGLRADRTDALTDVDTLRQAWSKAVREGRNDDAKAINQQILEAKKLVKSKNAEQPAASPVAESPSPRDRDSGDGAVASAQDGGGPQSGAPAREFVGAKRGDFYEIEGENAREAAKVLGVTLQRSRNGNEPMVGWPYHAHERNVAALAQAGITFTEKPAKPAAPDAAAPAEQTAPAQARVPQAAAPESDIDADAKPARSSEANLLVARLKSLTALRNCLRG